MEETTAIVTSGLFIESLLKNNKQIKQTRAQSLAEDLEFAYRTAIEKLRREIREKKRELEDSLDLYPSSTTSLEMAKNFNADSFVEKDIKINVDIRQLEIKLEIAESRYKLLLGKTC